MKILFDGQECEIDEDLRDRICKHPWRAAYGRSGKYFGCFIGKKKILLHRFVYQLKHEEIPNGAEIDHIDRNPANNTAGNLRALSRSENKVNTGLPKNNTSGHKGVRWYRAYQKWAVMIKKDRKIKFFGYFSEKNDAIRAAKIAYNKLYPQICSL